MPSEPSASERALSTMRENIGLAQQFIGSATLVEFENDTRTLYAVIRCLEIISEASRRLPADVKSRHPGLAWNKIAGAGNVYRHDYESLTTEVIWNTVQSLPLLLESIEAELSRLQDR